MKFIDRAKRRRAGIYLVRTRKHRSAMGGPSGSLWPVGDRENGYVGRSNFVTRRRLCHLGMCGLHRTCIPKPWTDLDPTWWTLRLPWWLSWKWCQASIEALAIWLLMPRYNVLLNRRNPRRVTPYVQGIQRAARDRARHHIPAQRVRR